MTTMKEFINKIREAQKLALREHITANAIVINTNFVKTPFLRSGYDGILPPMICGLEMYFTEDELPENYSFAIMEAITERERLIKETETRVATEILSYVGNLLDDGDRFKREDYEWYNRLRERYGVEVE